MKRYLLAIIVFGMILLSCDPEMGSHGDSIGNDQQKPETETQETPENPETQGVLTAPIITDSAVQDLPKDPVQEEIENDPRLVAFGSKSAKWLRRPGSRAIIFNIADGDPIAAYCTERGWSYICYDDQAVIGYEPFPDRISVMHDAVRITVESHNLEKPTEKWWYINVPPQPPLPPVTSNDPILGKWEYALCLDNGSIVEGPHSAEYDWEWAMWKNNVVSLTVELYNRDHDPDAHIVWGTEE